MKNIYCSKCRQVGEAKQILKDEEYEVRGDRFTIKSKVYVCTKCDEEIFDEEVEKENLELLYSMYRKKHSLLTPDDIKDIRKKYGLSQRAMSRLLEWGEVTFSRYENGSIQDSIHNSFLELIKKTENMLKIFEKNKHLLTEKERNKLGERLEQLIGNKKAEEGLVSIFEAYFTDTKEINEYTGFKPFNLQKIKDLILYITQKSKRIMPTKVNKLLFYIDFLFFKTYSVSLTGNKYVHLQYGPIPNDYSWIINLLVSEGLLERNEVAYSRKVIGEELIAKESIKENTFNEDELRVISYCLEKFKNFNCVQISKHSHEEKPYKATEEKKYISYVLSKDLSLKLE